MFQIKKDFAVKVFNESKFLVNRILCDYRFRLDGQK